jgi:hypothetical protein
MMVKRDKQKRRALRRMDVSTASTQKLATTRTVSEWFALLDRFASDPFMPDGRRQPKMPTCKVASLLDS